MTTETKEIRYEKRGLIPINFVEQKLLIEDVTDQYESKTILIGGLRE